VQCYWGDPPLALHRLLLLAWASLGPSQRQRRASVPLTAIISRQSTCKKRWSWQLIRKEYHLAP